LSELLTETAAAGAAVAFTEHSDHVVRSTATRVCELRNGRLQIENAPTALTEITLTAGHDLDWTTTQPDVLEVRHNANGVTLILPTGRHDAALLTALNHGWSVTTVRQVRPE
jgi:ABC-type multidrug transport system ATPase subunit